MSKRFVCSMLLLLLILTCSMGMSQKLEVDTFYMVPGDLTASTLRRNDVSGTGCALIKVRLPLYGATFQGNVVEPTSYSQSEYMVYVANNSKKITVKLEGYSPVDVYFNRWNIDKVESLRTYILSIKTSDNGGRFIDDGLTYFSLTVTPKNAIVIVDDGLKNLDSDGIVSLRLPRGTHHYKISTEGYMEKEGSFTLGKTRVDIVESLVSTQASLTIRCATKDADIYINDMKRGSGSWNGTLPPGNYLIEARKDGLTSQFKSISLKENQTLQVDLPTLVAAVGQLDVNYKPIASEVWIDGMKAGTSPDVFKSLSVGSHRVEIRKNGYQSKTETVTIVEGQTASLSGSLAINDNNTHNKQTFTVNGVSFTMIRVEGGTFMMGATSEQGSDAYDNEKPAHEVTLSSFSIGETEVTQELWEAVMGSNPSHFKGSKRPVENVCWYECQEFIKKLYEKTGQNFRLPTEAEWEFAARGGNKSKGYKYSGSNNLESVAWHYNGSNDPESYALYYENSYAKGVSSPDYGTHKVATKQPNELGLYDMSGNVYEWCQDKGSDYSGSSQTNPQGLDGGRGRVIRGGCCFALAGFCRSSSRNFGDPEYFNCAVLGLRLALSE